MLPKWFREYLSFHRTERNGVVVLCLILIGLIGFNIYQRVFWKKNFEEVDLRFGDAITEFNQIQDSLKASNSKEVQPWIPKTISYFQFDPNTLDSAGWTKLGFSPKQAASIIKYRNAGAVFRKPEDVKKLFVVDVEKYSELAPFIRIRDIPRPQSTQSQYRNFQPREKPAPEAISVELNAADTTELKKLKGIGPSYAKRIIKYRELLGGYRFKEQLLEVYGMDSARYLAIAENLLVDTTFRERININLADFKSLLRHPYLDKNQTKAIVNYRKQHGRFNSVSELRKIHLIDDSSFWRIAPYVKTQ